MWRRRNSLTQSRQSSRHTSVDSEEGYGSGGGGGGGAAGSVPGSRVGSASVSSRIGSASASSQEGGAAKTIPFRASALRSWGMAVSAKVNAKKALRLSAGGGGGTGSGGATKNGVARARGAFAKKMMSRQASIAEKVDDVSIGVATTQSS